MFNAFSQVTKTSDKSNEVIKALEKLARTEIYVGIPEGSDRPDEKGQPITNAQLLFVQSNGVRQKAMREEMNPKVESGEMTYSAAYQMWLQTHGSPLWAIPPRPVLEPAIEYHREEIAQELRKVVDAALNGQDTTPALVNAGLAGQKAAKGWFRNPANGWEPNAPTTIKRKGSDRPLIDTGEMRDQIVYIIEEG